MSLITRLIIATVFNSSLFIILIIGIQNSSNKIKVNFLRNETVFLPTAFIIGSSFIMGSITGSLLSLNFAKKNEN